MLIKKYIRLSAMIPQCIQCRQFHYDGWYIPPKSGIQPIRKNTTALVLGWAGSNPKYVQVYSKFELKSVGLRQSTLIYR